MNKQTTIRLLFFLLAVAAIIFGFFGPKQPSGSNRFIGQFVVVLFVLVCLRFAVKYKGK
jgi:hypothetical protein